MWLAAAIGLGIGLVLNVCADRLPLKAETRPSSPYHATRWCALISVSVYLCAYVQHNYGWSLSCATLVAYCSLFLLIAVVDLEHSLVPNILVASGMVLALGFNVVSPTPGLVAGLWGAVVGGGAFGLLALVRRNALGAGDVKLAALIGMMTGFPGVLLALILGILLGGLAAAIFMITGIRRRNQYMPYAPYLAAGSAATLLHGQQIMSWYAGLIGLGG